MFSLITGVVDEVDQLRQLIESLIWQMNVKWELIVIDQSCNESVGKLCDEMAEKLGIPSGIISRTPSAGLWDGQTDEEEMDITYRDLDVALEVMEKDGKAGNDNIKKVLKMNELSKHKMRVPAVFNQ